MKTGGYFGESNHDINLAAALFFEDLCQKIGGRAVVCFMIDMFGHEETIRVIDRLIHRPGISGRLLVSTYEANRSTTNPYSQKV